MPVSPVAAALALCALALPLSIAASNVALALLAAALLARARADGGRMIEAWRSEPVVWALVAYGAAGLASAALCAAPAPALRDALKDWHRLWSLGLFAAAFALEPEAPARKALGLSLAAAAAIGIVQVPLYSDPSDALARARAFVHPVVFGEMMALAALGGACLLLRPAPGTRRGAAAFLGLILAALALSQTRMALIGSACGFAAVCLLEPRARRWAPAAAVLFAAAVVGWELLPTGGHTMSSVLTYDPANPQQTRYALWRAACRMFADRPWTGVGPGGFRRLFTIYHAGPLDGETVWGSAHNLYLHQLAERGLLGGAALAALCAAMFFRALRAAREGGLARQLLAPAAVVAFLVMSLTETAFQNEQFAALLLFVWAWGTMELRRPSIRGSIPSPTRNTDPRP